MADENDNPADAFQAVEDNKKAAALADAPADAFQAVEDNKKARAAEKIAAAQNAPADALIPVTQNIVSKAFDAPTINLAVAVQQEDGSLKIYQVEYDVKKQSFTQKGEPNTLEAGDEGIERWKQELKGQPFITQKQFDNAMVQAPAEPVMPENGTDKERAAYYSQVIEHARSSVAHAQKLQPMLNSSVAAERDPSMGFQRNLGREEEQKAILAENRLERLKGHVAQDANPKNIADKVEGYAGLEAVADAASRTRPVYKTFDPSSERDVAANKAKIDGDPKLQEMFARNATRNQTHGGAAAEMVGRVGGWNQLNARHKAAEEAIVGTAEERKGWFDEAKAGWKKLQDRVKPDRDIATDLHGRADARERAGDKFMARFTTVSKHTDGVTDLHIVTGVPTGTTLTRLKDGNIMLSTKSNAGGCIVMSGDNVVLPGEDRYQIQGQQQSSNKGQSTQETASVQSSEKKVPEHLRGAATKSVKMNGIGEIASSTKDAPTAHHAQNAKPITQGQQPSTGAGVMLPS